MPIQTLTRGDVNKQESKRGLYEDYIDNLCSWLQKYSAEATKTRLFKEFSSWLKGISSKYQIIFLTTNYDLLLEFMIKEANLEYEFLDNGNSAIAIRKLHGSLGWFYNLNYELAGKEEIFNGKEEKVWIYDFATECKDEKLLSLLHKTKSSRSDDYAYITLIPLCNFRHFEF